MYPFDSAGNILSQSQNQMGLRRRTRLARRNNGISEVRFVPADKAAVGCMLAHNKERERLKQSEEGRKKKDLYRRVEQQVESKAAF